jgi:hypothetical protein
LERTEEYKNMCRRKISKFGSHKEIKNVSKKLTSFFLVKEAFRRNWCKLLKDMALPQSIGRETNSFEKGDYALDFKRFDFGDFRDEGKFLTRMKNRISGTNLGLHNTTHSRLSWVPGRFKHLFC